MFLKYTTYSRSYQLLFIFYLPNHILQIDILASYISLNYRKSKRSKNTFSQGQSLLTPNILIIGVFTSILLDKT